MRIVDYNNYVLSEVSVIQGGGKSMEVNNINSGTRYNTYLSNNTRISKDADLNQDVKPVQNETAENHNKELENQVAVSEDGDTLQITPEADELEKSAKKREALAKEISEKTALKKEISQKEKSKKEETTKKTSDKENLEKEKLDKKVFSREVVENVKEQKEIAKEERLSKEIAYKERIKKEAEITAKKEKLEELSEQNRKTVKEGGNIAKKQKENISGKKPVFTGKSDSEVARMYIKGEISRAEYDSVIEKREEFRKKILKENKEFVDQTSEGDAKNKNLERFESSLETILKETTSGTEAMERLDIIEKLEALKERKDLQGQNLRPKEIKANYR